MIKKNILLIGHKGYIGTVLSEQINKNLKNKINIIGVDFNLFSLNKYFKKKNKFKNIDLDCRRLNLKKILPKPDIIIYLAAVSNDPMGNQYKIATDEINYLNCIRIAREAKKLKIEKFIFASSCSMYGASGNKKKKKPINCFLLLIMQNQK